MPIMIWLSGQWLMGVPQVQAESVGEERLEAAREESRPGDTESWDAAIERQQRRKELLGQDRGEQRKIKNDAAQKDGLSRQNNTNTSKSKEASGASRPKGDGASRESRAKSRAQSVDQAGSHRDLETRPRPEDTALAKCLDGLTAGWRECGEPIPLIPKSSVAPVLRHAGGPDAVLYDWQGAAMIQEPDRTAMFFHGSGGHSQWGGNESYLLDLDSLEWELTNCSTTQQTGCPHDLDQGGDWGIGAVCRQRYADGAPNSVHIYDGLVYAPGERAVYRFGGATYCPVGNNRPSADMVWKLTLDNQIPKAPDTWEMVASGQEIPLDLSRPKTVYDPGRRQILVMSRHRHAWFDPETNRFVEARRDLSWVPQSSATRLDARTYAYLDKVRDPDGGGKRTALRFRRFANTSSLIRSCPIPLRNWDTKAGLAATASGDRVVVWQGRETVLILRWRKGCAWQQYEPAASEPAPRGGPGASTRVFSKFAYLPRYDVFVGLHRHDTGLWVLKLPEKMVAPERKVELREKGYTCSDAVAGWTCPDLSRAVAKAAKGVKLTLPKGDYKQCFRQPKNKALKLNFQGGRLHGHACDGKAAIVQNADLTLENLECFDVAVASGNGACVRQQGGRLTLRNVYFHDAQSGIMSSSKVGSLRIEDSRLIDLGGDCSIRCGRAHPVYYKGPELHIVGSVIARARDQAHLVKTGAVRTVIANSQLDETGGQGSRIIDAYNGGDLSIRNSRLTAQRGDGNQDVIGYDYEGRRGTERNRIEIHGSRINCAGGPLIAGRGSLGAAMLEFHDNRISDCRDS